MSPQDTVESGKYFSRVLHASAKISLLKTILPPAALIPKSIPPQPEKSEITLGPAILILGSPIFFFISYCIFLIMQLCHFRFQIPSMAATSRGD
ncbi:hypothetical protein XAC3562_100078 [Xanthomonas citri pv. citri]|uniref:Uncharacterized protein n=1 Tax=Xanthomonas citri pv. citri TaxID=611301 RepID=A0A0U5BN85_XANCI|nr:hypothetical protein XAC3562_100078 [Xanthomonas citri pv. citri]CEH53787.1 hypothetical protein XACLD7_1830002 [Xanthomonas citri pv. citri]CEH82282.1 hypothetical protein XACLH37_270002 [Xanthomonas citri pv. citri]CEH84337.1 hypothetical protein XAC3612_300002 [Xanthomonas citri pv. citri]CEJ21907.1 hypothetical protein XACE116_1470007 [Xanthomonas citri pv. citri]